MECDNLIIDGSNIEYRMFFISKKGMSPEDVSTEKNECVFGFLQVFKNLVKKFQPNNIYVCWDKKLTYPSTNFRDALTKNTYKAHRTKPIDIEDMYRQELITVEILKTLGSKCLFPNILEGDDVMAWLSHNMKGNNVVVSVDRDLLQLISDQTVIFNPSTKVIINKANFEREVGIKQEYFKLYKAIWGDAGDNVEGLPGYGKVKGKKLAENWTTTNVSDEYKLIVEQNLKVVDLSIGYTMHEDEVPVYQRQLAEQEHNSCDMKKFKELCKQYGFDAFVSNIGEWDGIFNKNKLASMFNSYFKSIST